MQPRQTLAPCALVQVLALCAVAMTLATATAAVAQDAGQPAVRADGSTAAAPKRATHRRAAQAPAKTAGRKTAAPKAAAPVANSYQLVPTSPTGSALARARQNAFGTPDDEAAPSIGSHRVGIGLGGGNGTTPGVTLGF